VRQKAPSQAPERGADQLSGGASVYAMLTLTVALWGSAFPASKVVVDSVPHQVAALLRFGFGGLVIVAWLLASGRRLTVSLADLGRTAVAGMLGVFGYNTLFFWGLSLAPSIDGSIIVPVFAPVITTAISVLLLRERTSGARIAGLALGIGGSVVFLLGVGSLADGRRLLGDLVYLAAAVSWSAYTLVAKRILKGDPLKATALATLCGSVALAAFAAPALHSVDWSGLSGDFWLIVAYLAVGPTAIAYVFYYRGVHAVGPTTASVMMFLSPVFGGLGSALFLHEKLTWLQAAGTALMVVGALLAVTGRLLPRWRRANGATAEADCEEPSPTRESTTS
jgi:drug/metabolite transporter (DMT)-like permease